jgi:hypothetical protein
MVRIFRATSGRILLQMIHPRPRPQESSEAASSPGPIQIIGMSFAAYNAKPPGGGSHLNPPRGGDHLKPPGGGFGWRGPSGPLRRAAPSRQPGFFSRTGEMYRPASGVGRGNFDRMEKEASRPGAAAWTAAPGHLLGQEAQKGNHHLTIMVADGMGFPITGCHEKPVKTNHPT